MRLGVLSICGCLLWLFVGGSFICEGVVCDPVRADEDAVVRPVASGAVRVATFNCSLNRETAGQLERDLSTDGDLQARRVARVLRTVRPDLVLLNEFDFSESGQAAQLFLKNYLAADVSWSAEPALKYEYWWSGPVNTGVPTGLDLDHDGKTDGPGDAFGFGRFPGQYGMLLLSKYPIDTARVRTFQKLLWQQMPGALLPVDPGTQQGWYSAGDLQQFRLSSKSHWDIPVKIEGRELHVLASHPTPPAFDGAEDRNGRRNHDEIRLWKDYLTVGADSWIRDDAGVSGGLAADAAFVILGDLNADPVDGGSVSGAIQQLLGHARVQAVPVPASAGGVQAAASQKGANLQHRGIPAEDTADFSDRSVGNLRADYVLPSVGVKIEAARVYWPATGESAELVECSDHRLVFLDLRWK